MVATHKTEELETSSPINVPMSITTGGGGGCVSFCFVVAITSVHLLRRDSQIGLVCCVSGIPPSWGLKWEAEDEKKLDLFKWPQSAIHLASTGGGGGCSEEGRRMKKHEIQVSWCQAVLFTPRFPPPCRRVVVELNLTGEIVYLLDV